MFQGAERKSPLWLTVRSGGSEAFGHLSLSQGVREVEGVGTEDSGYGWQLVIDKGRRRGGDLPAGGWKHRPGGTPAAGMPGPRCSRLVGTTVISQLSLKFTECKEKD